MALAAVTRGEEAVRGSKAYSESSMVMAMSQDGSSALTLRFCRFPEEGFTWLWCHVVKDGAMYAYTNHDLPADKRRLAGAPAATYDAPPVSASLARDGGGATLKSVRIDADLMMHRSRRAPHGPGKHAVRLRGVFTPTHVLNAKVLDGRDEVYGTFAGEVTVDGKAYALAGLSKFHEQRQEAARFDPPFNYAWLAGPGIAGTTLMGAKGGGGGFVIDGVEDVAKSMKADPPGNRRDMLYVFEKAGPTPGRLDAVVRYQVPIFGKAWRGSFVRGTVGTRAVVGVSNDWLNGPGIYGKGA